MPQSKQVQWQLTQVLSPCLGDPLQVLVARDIQYVANGNRLQNLSIYLPVTKQTSQLVNTVATSIPTLANASPVPRCHVHIHGGAWRDPQLKSTSIEPAVAHAFSHSDDALPIEAIVSLNYTITKFPTHPTLPYDPEKDHHSDPAREAVHPQHVVDVLHAFALLRTFGLTDGSYVLSGHSCGACISLQAILQSPQHWTLDQLPEPPKPAAFLGLNGLYHLQELVSGLGTSHEHLRDDYDLFLGNAFGPDKDAWPAASPAQFNPEQIQKRVQEGRAPSLIILDQSTDDQLVPMNQREWLETNLAKVPGLRVVRGHRCVGRHAAPWEHGYMIWEGVQDLLKMIREDK